MGPVLQAPYPTESASNADRLDSWKEIAAYLKRGTRTVQRWEREIDLPVHRLRDDRTGAIYAFKSELDAWWAQRGALRDSSSAIAHSLAVLRFTDMSPNSDQAHFCDGLAEEIIDSTSRFANLRVASRMSSFPWCGSQAGCREIGRSLGVGLLVDGSVRKAGDRLRISVQLIEVDTGFQIWSARFDRETGDVFAVQDEIAQSVASALIEHLT